MILWGMWAGTGGATGTLWVATGLKNSKEAVCRRRYHVGRRLRKVGVGSDTYQDNGGGAQLDCWRRSSIVSVAQSTRFWCGEVLCRDVCWIYAHIGSICCVFLLLHRPRLMHQLVGAFFGVLG